MLRAMQFRPLVLWLLGIGALAGAGCAYGDVRQVVRAQFASELDCPEVQLKRRDAWYGREGHQFKVTGCGVVRTYTCEDVDSRVSYDEPACTWVNGDIDAPQLMKPPAEEQPLDESEGLEAEPPPADEPPADEPKSKTKPKLEDPTLDEEGAPLDSEDGASEPNETEEAPAKPEATHKK